MLLQLAELRKRTDCLPDDYFVVLVGDMITEEALPTYMAMLNTLDGVREETGAEKSAWGRELFCSLLCSYTEHVNDVVRILLSWKVQVQVDP